MNEKEVFRFLKDLGCCDACSFRYLGTKNSKVFENPAEYVSKYQEDASLSTGNTETPDENRSEVNNKELKYKAEENGSEPNGVDGEEPAPKRRKWAVCVSCIGILQEETWQECFQQVKHVLEKKRYACDTFACGLSAPIATILREKIITLMLKDKFPLYTETAPTPLKEAWKWSCGARLAAHIDKTLDSGAVAPLLITVNMDYPDDLEELEPLKILSPALFNLRNRQKKRFTVEFTRRSVEQALDGATLKAIQRVWTDTLPSLNVPAKCLSIVCSHAPMYLGGRYIKLSRELPQTPWVLNGVRMMESSVQEIIMGPIAEFYKISEADMDHRLKFISAGREDVDVRCLGTGRPFAIEVSDPCREPNPTELQSICNSITKDGRVVIKNLQIISKDELTLLKQGEETKCKTYEALCIKLSHSKYETNKGPQDPISVTQEDIERINSFRNTQPGEEGRIEVLQKTPIRVLHRRPLLTRLRKILDLQAELVPGHPQLILLKIMTSAGTYVKEFVHGELGRTTPPLGSAIDAAIDILALDVNKVHLEWPTNKC